MFMSGDMNMLYSATLMEVGMLDGMSRRVSASSIIRQAVVAWHDYLGLTSDTS